MKRRQYIQVAQFPEFIERPIIPTLSNGEAALRGAHLAKCTFVRVPQPSRLGWEIGSMMKKLVKPWCTCSLLLCIVKPLEQIGNTAIVVAQPRNLDFVFHHQAAMTWGRGSQIERQRAPAGGL